MRKNLTVSMFILLVAVLVLSACGSATPQTVVQTQVVEVTSTPGPAAPATETPLPAGSVQITGAGATFPLPLYTQWTYAYQFVDPSVAINYNGVGSGAGKTAITLPRLVLDRQTLVDIYNGTVSMWNDPKVVALNPGLKDYLPAANITTVHRSDGSGTTDIFTHALASFSSDWTAGAAQSVQWPVKSSLGGKGNPGVAALIVSTPNSIGYVELAYARQNKLAYAEMQNASGAFIAPTIEATTEAAAGAAKALDKDTDYRISIVNAPGKKAYPICSFTWLLVYEKMPDAAKAKKVADFLKYALTEGQKSAPSLDYAPLPSNIAKSLDKRVATLTSSR
jgi:phosphate transport system substrate-binding protein